MSGSLARVLLWGEEAGSENISPPGSSSPSPGLVRSDQPGHSRRQWRGPTRYKVPALAGITGSGGGTRQGTTRWASWGRKYYDISD